MVYVGTEIIRRFIFSFFRPTWAKRCTVGMKLGVVEI